MSKTLKIFYKENTKSLISGRERLWFLSDRKVLKEDERYFMDKEDSRKKTNQSTKTTTSTDLQTPSIW